MTTEWALALKGPREKLGMTVNSWLSPGPWGSRREPWEWYPFPLQVVSLLPPRAGRYRGALLFDRDGTLIMEREFLAEAAGVELVPEAVTAFRLARLRGWAVGLITNQGGIALGRFGWAELAAVQTALDEALRRLDLELDLALACPHHPQGGHPLFGSSAAVPLGRKPNPGMVTLAMSLLNLGPEAEVLVVGDKASDIAAAAAAGCSGLRVPTRKVRESGGPEAAWQAVFRRIQSWEAV